MAEELYEELPDQIQDYPEDLYEDLPANELNYPDDNHPYNPNAFVGGISPPPLPSGPIPTHRPGGPPPPSQMAPPPPSAQPPPPPLPTRAPSTTLSAGSTKTLQVQNKKNKPDTKKKGATIARSGGGSSGGGGGGGIDMSEVLKRARMRSERAIEDLENKRNQREDADSEDNKPAAPWLNQLRKTAPIHPKPKPIREVPAQVNGTKEDEVPEFIRKARTLSVSMENDADIGVSNKPVSPTVRKPPPVTAKPPPITAKPRLPTPSMPTDSNQPEVQEKPAWMKQRERQVKMASEMAKPAPGPKPSAALPNGSPAHAVTSSAPPPAKKPRPVPAPRGITSPKKEHQPIANEPTEQGSPSVTCGGSVRDRARTLERGMSGSVSPPPSPKGLPPKLVPPTRTTPTHQVGSITTVVSLSKPPVAGRPGPPPPVRREFKEPAPSPPVEPPPSPVPPPIPTKGPPPPPPTFSPPSAPATQGEPTPPMVSLQKFRRLPLQSVDIFNPPGVPSRNTKPSGPIATEEGILILVPLTTA